MSVTYQCEYCKKIFIGSPSRGKAKHICCSRSCRSQLIQQKTKENQLPNVNCSICGKNFWVKPSYLKRHQHFCCSKECLSKLRSYSMLGEKNHQYGLLGEENPTWKSNEKITNYGYKQIRVFDHPFGTKQHWVFEHRLIAEQYLLTEENSIEINGKKYLKPEYDVHHIDQNKLNNNPQNLLVLLKSEHRKLHNKINQHQRDNLGRFCSKENKNVTIKD